MKVAFPPDSYYAPVFASAALHFFDATIFENELLLLLLGTLASYWIALTVLRWLTPAKAHIYATLIVTLALVVYWFWIDRALHANNRYYMRTALLIVTPVLGALAAAQALAADTNRNARRFPGWRNSQGRAWTASPLGRFAAPSSW